MKVQVRKEATTTKDFEKNFIKKITKNKPLQKGEVLKIELDKEFNPLPSFIQFPQEKEKEDIAQLKEYRSLKPQDPERDYIPYFKKLFAAKNHIEELLKDKIRIEGVVITPPGSYPKKMGIKIVIEDPEEITRIAKERDLNLSSTKNPKFIESPPKIIWGGEVVPIPVDSKEFYVCKVLFNKKPGTIVSWDEIFEEITGDEPLSPDGWRIIYDAVRRVNKKVKRKMGRKIFNTRKKSFSRVC